MCLRLLCLYYPTRGLSGTASSYQCSLYTLQRRDMFVWKLPLWWEAKICLCVFFSQTFQASDRQRCVAVGQDSQAGKREDLQTGGVTENNCDMLLDKMHFFMFCFFSFYVCLITVGKPLWVPETHRLERIQSALLWWSHLQWLGSKQHPFLQTKDSELHNTL